MRSVGLNQKIAFPHFRHAQVENHAGTALAYAGAIHSEPGVAILTPQLACVQILGGFTSPMLWGRRPQN